MASNVYRSRMRYLMLLVVLGACGEPDVNTRDVVGLWSFTYDSQTCSDTAGERWTSEVNIVDGQPPERDGNMGGQVNVSGQFVSLESWGNGDVLYAEFTLGDDPIGVVDLIDDNCEVIDSEAVVEKLSD